MNKFLGNTLPDSSPLTYRRTTMAKANLQDLSNEDLVNNFQYESSCNNEYDNRTNVDKYRKELLRRLKKLND